MRTYMSVTITTFTDLPRLNRGYIHIIVDSCNLDTFITVSQEEGLRKLYNLSRRLNIPVTMYNNSVNPRISYREVRGYLD